MGCAVTVVDNLSSGIGPAQWPKIHGLPDFDPFAVEFYLQDMRDYFRENSAAEFDTVFHCAAVVGGRLKIDGDPLAVATDLAIDADFFNWCVRAPHKPKVVYFSSSAVYPIELQTEFKNCLLAESLVHFNGTKLGMPDMTYGWAKLTGELLAQHAVTTYGLDVVIYRPFSGYGEDQALDYPFPSIIQRVLNREAPIVVWGSGNQTRDFIHIEDVVSCVLATMHKMVPGEMLNIGSGVSTSFMTLAEDACAALQLSATIVNDPSKPEGVFARVADIHKMQQWFTPSISLEEGILHTAQHLLKQGYAETRQELTKALDGTNVTL